ncbi:predicted protein [Plenodomus lingam JN3]|uniref:Predicted protein n=1 Tax=Leptosphaeria maculans (strain JN3 / isolate v23.1.3 / race Av1-4-5-6-7-8) TaxID=985895 RepID=E4ZYD3_LEPMJ|nr:predicted protein [Plenodomus lingam JN3]CBX96378.1 predicted protein [Plenodomus lingam JN3]
MEEAAYAEVGLIQFQRLSALVDIASTIKFSRKP